MRLLKWQLVVTLASQGSPVNSLSGKSYACDLPHL
jgi:hypothetical protein